MVGGKAAMRAPYWDERLGDSAVAVMVMWLAA